MPAIFTHLHSAKGALGGSWQSWSPATRPGKKGEAASYLGLATFDPPFASNLQWLPSISSSSFPPFQAQAVEDLKWASCG